LREKLGPLGDYIETLRGVGYRFREETEWGQGFNSSWYGLSFHSS
jgi:DNA-binding winged helix-turn-helix (wHTH) protein